MSVGISRFFRSAGPISGLGNGWRRHRPLIISSRMLDSIENITVSQEHRKILISLITKHTPSVVQVSDARLFVTSRAKRV